MFAVGTRTSCALSTTCRCWLYCLFLGFLFVTATAFLVSVAVTVVVHTSEVSEGLAEVKIVFKSFPVVEVVEVHSYLHRFVESVKNLCRFFVLIVFSVFDALRSLLALKDVEKAISCYSLHNCASFTSFLVLLLFLNLLFGEVFTVFPVNQSALRLNNFVLLVVFKSNHKLKSFVGEVLVVTESKLDTDSSRLLCFGSFDVGDVLQGLRVFLADGLHHHLVVFDCFFPEVRNANYTL